MFDYPMKNNLLNANDIEVVMQKLYEMYPEASCALNHNNHFELLIAVALSAQTTDVSVNKITPDLFEKYPTPEKLASADIGDVENKIKTIGLFRTKSKNIINLSKDLCDRFGGEVPGNYDDLVSLPGVGRKTANVVLAEAFGVPRIAVDTHVFRVSNRIGIVDEPDVLKTEESLMKRIPKENWILFHHLLIFHGRRCCTARNPNCNECLIKDICLYNNK